MKKKKASERGHDSGDDDGIDGSGRVVPNIYWMLIAILL